MSGDFNCVDSVNLDTLAHQVNTSSVAGATILKELVESHQLKDTFRDERPMGDGFTWFSADGRQASRIDSLNCPVGASVKIGAEFFPYSDHKCFKACLSFQKDNQSTGKSYWKLNTSVLEDERYIMKV